MKKLFSETVGFPPAPEIDDEAPGWLREALIVRAISPLLRVEQPHNILMRGLRDMEQLSQRPIDCSTLIEHIALANQISPATYYRNSLGAVTALTGLLMSLSWGRFYDVLELLARELDGGDRNPGIHHAKFREIVNTCFSVGHVNWFLSDNNTLERLRSGEFVQLEEEVRKDTDQPFVANLDKAKGFLNKRPCDSANAIKESVCAVESFAKTLAPKAATLGDAVKQLSKQKAYPPLMLTLIDKLYAFTSAEPGVRHGSPQEERVIRADAEFSYVTSLAIIRYLRDSRE